MFKDTQAFSGFSVNDMAAAKKFYGETLGLDLGEDQMGFTLKIAGGNSIFVYQKDNHEPATFTILNFPVDDIDKTIDELTAKGVKFEHYDNLGFDQDEKGVARGLATNMGPDIAWFKDPAGNVLAVLQEK
jgi:catechol 2,3-dioxygenase-like lactoylglutathione lyase family enzyme